MTDFERLFEENNEFIFKYLMKLTHNPSLAEELTQETFYRAYMNYAGLRNKEKAGVWLCQIAKNAYFAWYNDEKKRRSLNEAEAVQDSLEDAFIRKDISEKALKHLHELNEPYKEVFMLSVFGGVSFKSISEIFGKSESWARVTFYRAKQKLYEKLR